MERLQWEFNLKVMKKGLMCGLRGDEGRVSYWLKHDGPRAHRRQGLERSPHSARQLDRVWIELNDRVEYWKEYPFIQIMIMKANGICFPNLSVPQSECESGHHYTFVLYSQTNITLFVLYSIGGMFIASFQDSDFVNTTLSPINPVYSRFSNFTPPKPQYCGQIRYSLPPLLSTLLSFSSFF